MGRHCHFQLLSCNVITGGRCFPERAGPPRRPCGAASGSGEVSGRQYRDQPAVYAAAGEGGTERPDGIVRPGPLGLQLEHDAPLATRHLFRGGHGTGRGTVPEDRDAGEFRHIVTVEQPVDHGMLHGRRYDHDRQAAHSCRPVPEKSRGIPGFFQGFTTRRGQRLPPPEPPPMPPVDRSGRCCCISSTRSW